MTLPISFDGAIDEHLQRFSFVGSSIEAGAVIAAASSGMIAARNKQMDLVGTYIVAFVNAFGGGTLRDVLLDRRPLFWVNAPEYPVIVFAIALLFVYFPRPLAIAKPWIRQWFAWVDALGLALFTVSGASYALSYEMPVFVASLLGVITGVFGGVLRDILIAEIPMIFRTQSSLYATCSFLGCWVFFGALGLQISPAVSATLGFTATFLLRMLSIRYTIRLPKPRYLDCDEV
jgi:uncharacterized membrane protein YeiH